MGEDRAQYAEQGRDRQGRAQYTEQGRDRQDRVQYIPNNRTHNAGAQGSGGYGGRGQNGKVQYIQGNMVQSRDARYKQAGRAQHARSRAQGEREYLVRQQQQMQQQQKSLKKRIGVLTFLVCILLMFNLVFMAVMHLRIEHMNEVFRRMEGSLSAEGQADSTDGIFTSSDGQAGARDGSMVAGGQPDSGTHTTGQDYVSLCGLDYVDRPRERTPEQVLERLYQLAEEDSRVAEILDNSYRYPDKLLEALANNPEMTDFVMGYEKNAGTVSGALTRQEAEQEYPLFLQWDPRWGYGDYGDGSNIGLAGCGPTCLSMALYYLTGNEELTPDKMAEYSMENGYYISGTGTAWALLQDVPDKYGIAVSQPKAEEKTMKAALDSGSVIICSMGPGDFTAAGHFIVIYGYDKTGFLVNDPNCVARSRQTWSFADLKGQIKNIWVLGGQAKTF